MFQSCMCYNKSILNHLIYWNQMIFGKPPQPPPPQITPSYKSTQDIDWDIIMLDQ